MKLNNRFLLGILSLILAAVIAFIALPIIARQTNGKTEIIRVKNQILKGSIITENDLEQIEVGSYNLPLDIAHSFNDVTGYYAATDFVPGTYILSSQISDTPISSDIALNDIPQGKVAISITIKTLASGLSDKLQSGDIIRIYHFLDSVSEIPELRFVKVLSVTDSKGANIDYSKELAADEEKLQTATITVVASPEQAAKITELENNGIIHVALITRNNEQLAEELLTAQDLMLQELYFPETLVIPEEDDSIADQNETPPAEPAETE